SRLAPCPPPSSTLFPYTTLFRSVSAKPKLIELPEFVEYQFKMHPESNLPMAKMKAGEAALNVELALTSRSQMNGLMHRYILPQNAGMLFVFAKEAPRSFWMKNTKIPLDIIYMDGKGVVVDIVKAEIGRASSRAGR